MRISAIVVLFLAACVSKGLGADQDPQVSQIAAAFLKNVDAIPSSVTRAVETERPEDHCWVTFQYLSMPLAAYEITGDQKYLDMFVECFNTLKAKMEKGTDGYLGWYGKPLGTFAPKDNPGFSTDVIITSFRCVKILCTFIELIDTDPRMAEAYAAQRREYLTLMNDHLAKKWIARGCYVDLGKTGAIFRTAKGLAPKKADLTQPHNKHSLIIDALLPLYRITGNDEYMRMAVKLGTRYKRSLVLKDGHYEWHYWDPAGKWDVNPENAEEWKHWIGVEHKGGYYSSSLSQAVLLFQHGLVFDRTDLDRFLKTQLEMSWNGNVEAPKWARCDGTTSEKYMQGAYMCTALAPYSEKIETYCFGPKATAEKLKNAAHAWQGGPALHSWLAHKVSRLEKLKSDPRQYTSAGRKFLSKPDNRRFCEALAFTVEGSGYRTPRTPGEMEH